jgi:DNA polymerase-3 subunit delta
MFYVFHGDDEHSKRVTLADLQKKLGDPSLLDLNTIRFRAKNLSFAQLQHACDSIPFLAEKRLVIVEELLGNQPAYLEELVAYLPSLPETTRLVFMESRPIKDTHPVVKLAKESKKGYVKLFTRPEGGRLEAWIRQKVEADGGNIAPRAAHLLALNVGNDLALLANEIEKLVLYKGQETIEPQDVSLLCSFVAEANIFELVDALGSRHGRSAARLLQSKLDEGTDPAYLFAMFVRQFRLLIQVKELAEAGLRPPEIASRLNIHNYVTGKIYQQSHNFSLDQLETIYAHLLELDVAIKTGRTDMITALSLLVAGVTA